jgi:hypothetical protein
MAGVFLARERRPPRPVALKVMSPELMLGPNMIERFHQEAALQANLEHPNIATVYAVREQGGLQFFTMRYIPGRTLQAALRAEGDAGRRLDPEVAGAILHQIGAALEYAHGAGVVHRDVKPGNVLLDRDGRALLTDFGIAKVAEGPGLTMTSAALGTVAYMSPEQCYAEEVLTGASDQYSLGILAYELMAGQVPFTGDKFRVQQAHVTQVPPSLRTVRDDCPARFSDAVDRMLAKRPEQRFPDIATALDAMGAKPLATRRDDPVRVELVRLADCDAMWARLGDEVRRDFLTPRSSELVAISDVSAAGAASSTGDAGRVASIEISSVPAVLAIGERCRLAAICRNATGAVLEGVRLHWDVEPPDVALVGAGAQLVAQRWGSARLRVLAVNVTADVPLIVGSVPLRGIALDGVPARLPAGNATGVQVRMTDMTGMSRALPYTLSSTNTVVLTTDGVASLHALTPGRAELVACCGSYEARAAVTVVDA